MQQVHAVGLALQCAPSITWTTSDCFSDVLTHTQKCHWPPRSTEHYVKKLIESTNMKNWLKHCTRQLDTRWSINNNCRKIKHTMCGCWQCETITSTVVNIDNRCGHAYYSTCLIKLCHYFRQHGDNTRRLMCFNVGACLCTQSGLVHSSHSSDEVTVLKLSKKERHLCRSFDGHFHLCAECAMLTFRHARSITRPPVLVSSARTQCRTWWRSKSIPFVTALSTVLTMGSEVTEGTEPIIVTFDMFCSR